MPSSHDDAHPYGRSSSDVRRRNARSRRIRRVRITQLVVFSVVLIALVIAVVYAVTALTGPDPDAEPEAPAAATGKDDVVCPDPGAKPAKPADVGVRVLNGTSRQGLAGKVGKKLEDRGYDVGDAGNTNGADGPVTIVYGPDGYLAARAVGAQFKDVSWKVDSSLEDQRVNVLLGDDYDDVVSKKKANAVLTKDAPMPTGCPGAKDSSTKK
jgi:hypothetical protein